MPEAAVPEVVLVHGLWHRGWSTALLKRRLQRRGFQVRTFSYPTLARDPGKSAAALAEFCRAPAPEVRHLVGHSLGGLLILAMLEQESLRPPGRVLLLGTPLRGSQVARRVVRRGLGRLLLGRSRRWLEQGTHVVAGSFSCGMIAGNRGLGLGTLSGAGLGPGDGTVALEETRHALVDQRVELPVSHTGLLLSKSVADQAARYLESGHFDPV